MICVCINHDAPRWAARSDVAEEQRLAVGCRCLGSFTIWNTYDLRLRTTLESSKLRWEPNRELPQKICSMACDNAGCSLCVSQVPACYTVQVQNARYVSGLCKSSDRWTDVTLTAW